MMGRRWLAGILAALALCGARAETAAPAALSADTVVHLELRLVELGYLAGKADITYDDETALALRGFQQANGLEATGVADDATLAALNSGAALSRQAYLRAFAEEYAQQPVLQPGSSGKDVQAVQRRLTELGFAGGKSDGVFGESTAQSVRRFQQANGLDQTGVVDAATRMRLMADSAITWEGFLQEMRAAPGDTGLGVYILQGLLSDMGYFDGERTGSYGELTQQAVSRFQEANGLEATGQADATTVAKLYDSDAVSLRHEDALQLGDTGERVAIAQQRLVELGYLAQAADRFDYATETAVRLFQLGAGELSTGVLDGAGEAALLADTAREAQDEEVQRSFQALMESADADTRLVMAQTAEQLLGACFGTEVDDLYPGFGFVQYVCARANLPVQRPESLTNLAAEPVSDPQAVLAGDLVALQGASANSVSILLAIGAGDGRIYYTTEDGGWVVMGFIEQMNSTNIYRWSAPGEEAE